MPSATTASPEDRKVVASRERAGCGAFKADAEQQGRVKPIPVTSDSGYPV